MSRSHRARAVRPAESPAEDLRATHDAWTRDLRDRLPHDSDSSDGDTPPRARAPRRRSPTRDARREPRYRSPARAAPRHRSPARAAPEEPPVATGALERQVAGLVSAVQMLVEQQAAQLREQRTLQADMVQMLARRQSVAVGEVVPDALETGQSRMGAWNGRDHANTMPRLPEEMAYKDGLLTWTEENVGELFACIAYKHLTSVDDETYNEKAEEHAFEIKQAVIAQGVDGRALLHLTIEDMEKIGQETGVLEDGGECALKFIGHRIAILNSLVAFRDAHAHEPWATVKTLALLTHQGQDRDEDEAELTEQLCKMFGVDIIQGDNDDWALKAAMVHKSSKPKGARRQEVVVPVFATLLAKQLVEDADGNLELVGTFIQRPLLYDLAAFARESGDEQLPYFSILVNSDQSDRNLVLSKVARNLSAGPQAEGYFATTAATFAATLPLKLDAIYSAQPFNISAATVTIELASCTGTNALKETFELNPSFVSHASDLRNLCSVPDWKDILKLDRMRRWELVTPMPTIEYEYEGPTRLDPKKSLYVPRFSVTFYLYEDPTKSFAEFILPIALSYVASTWNLLHVGQKQDADYADYLANSAAISLVAIFVVGPMMASESCSFSAMNNLFALWTFLGLGLMVPAFYFPRLYQKLVIALMWTSMLVPFCNWLIYRNIKQKINLTQWETWKDLRMTFLGRPGSVSDWEQKHVKKEDTGKAANKNWWKHALSGDLRTFVVKNPRADPKKPKIVLNPDILSPKAMKTTYDEAGPGKSVAWQFDARNQKVYCGLTPFYFQDTAIAKAIDYDKHNESYKIKMRIRSTQ